MFQDSDFLDDVLLPAATTKERIPSRFQPKLRAKAVKVPPAPSSTAAVSQPNPLILEPPSYDTDSKGPEEGSDLPLSSVSDTFSVAPASCVPQVSMNQPKSTHLEALISNNDSRGSTQQDQGNSGEDADVFSDVDYCANLIQPASSTARAAGRFKPKANLQSKTKKLDSPPSAVLSNAESAGASTLNYCSSVLEGIPSELQVTQQSLTGTREQETPVEASQDGAYITGSGVNLQSNSDRSEAKAMVLFSVEEFSDDIPFQPSATSDQRVGKFWPKQHPGIMKQDSASSNSGRPALVSPNLEHLPHASEVACTEQEPGLLSSPPVGSSIVMTCAPKIRDAQVSVDHLDDNNLHLNAENEEASEHDQENLAADVFFSKEFHADDLQCAALATEEPMINTEAFEDERQIFECDDNLHTVSDSLEEEGSLDGITLQADAPSERRVGKFRPKLVHHPEKGKTKSVSFVLPVAAESAMLSTESHSDMFVFNSTEMDSSFVQMATSDEFFNKNPHSSFAISDCSRNLQMDHGALGGEAALEYSGLQSFDNIFPQATSNAARSVGKFQPKCGIKTKVVRSSAAESSSQQSFFPTEPACKGHVSGFSAVSVDNPLTSNPPDFSQEQAEVVENFNLEVAHCESNKILQTTQETSLRDNSIGGEGAQSKNLENIGYEARPLDTREPTQLIQEQIPSSVTVKDVEFSKPSRKLRRGINACTSSKFEVRTNDEWDVEDPKTSQLDEDHSDDEYRIEEMPKQKKAPRKPKRQKTETEKPVQKRKKTSETPDSTIKEPPKKKFPHSTRRKRRQVDKVLLQTPEDEIDPRQISIRDLIILAEAKERILNKDTAASGKSFPDQRTLDENNPSREEQELNHDGHESNCSVLMKPTKLNYHSYMKRRQPLRWSKTETELFYQAIRQFGTDFAMIQQLFPNRSREQVKLKFKTEERKHPLQVHDALIHRSKDHSHFERVIQQLKTQAEHSSHRETAEDLKTRAPDEDEEQRVGVDKEEEQAANSWRGEEQTPMDSNDWKGGVQSPPKVNDFEGEYEWDASASYPEDMVEETHDGFW